MNKNDILENLHAGLTLLLAGAYTQMRKAEDKHEDSDNDVKDIAFEVLCALHDRCSKREIYDILDTRIRD
jgi:hypothetical protein